MGGPAERGADAASGPLMEGPPRSSCCVTSTMEGSGSGSSSGGGGGRRQRGRRRPLSATVVVAVVAIAGALLAGPASAFWLGGPQRPPGAGAGAATGRRRASSSSIAARRWQWWAGAVAAPPSVPGPLAAGAYMEAGDGGEEEDVLARIQAAVSLPDVVRRYTQEVEEKGDGEYMCRCLFHEDRNPSMSVNAAKGVYHCFSCGAGGNLFKLVAEMEGLSFREAVAFLADEAGIELPRGGALGPGKDYSRLHEALEAASEYYASVLAEAPGGPARSHLRARKTSPLLAADFQLGFSPPIPGGLWEHLAPRNFTEEELVGAGLFSPRALQVLRMPPLPPPSAARGGRNATADGDNGYAAPAPAPPARRLPFDRMGGRLVIPIRNARGQMVGFSGRLLTDEPLAKYVNTPETAIFKKRTLLYGLNKARAAIRETGRAIVVEGYFDVIALHGVGFKSTVACMGTALTADHLRSLRNALPPHDGAVVLVLDGDAAGVRAAERACKDVLVALEAEERFSGVQVKVAELPRGGAGAPKDPADFVLAKGPLAGSAFEGEVLGRAVSWKEWYATRLILDGDAGADGGDPEAAAKALREDTALFSKRSGALTDFLSRLPPTCQADRTFLCRLLAQKAFPEGGSVQERLTADLIEQCDEKRRLLTARLEQQQQQQQRAQERQQELRQQRQRQEEQRQQQAQQQRLQQQQWQQARQQQQQQQQRPPTRQQPPLPQQQQRPQWQQQQQHATPGGGGRYDARPQPAAAAAAWQQQPQAQAQPQQLPQGWQAAAPAPAPAPAASDAAVRAQVTDYERSLLELLIADPRARNVLREPTTGDQQLLLSTPAHQALFDWLLRVEARAGPGGAQQPLPVAVLRQQFEYEMPQLRAWLGYFDAAAAREHARHAPEALLEILQAALGFLASATLARRMESDSAHWSQRVQRLDIRAIEGISAPAPSPAPVYNTYAGAGAGAGQQPQQQGYYYNGPPQYQQPPQQPQYQPQPSPNGGGMLQRRGLDARPRWPSETGAGPRYYRRPPQQQQQQKQQQPPSAPPAPQQPQQQPQQPQ